MPLTKPWRSPGPTMARDLPGNLGVYELGDAAGEVLFIGYAGGRSLFGLRGAIGGHFADDEPNPVIRERATAYRYEVNQMYLTRWKELLMRYQAAHGRLPEGNHAPGAELPRLGQLSPI
ncbi:MAG: DUF7508 domain-containing protein [Dehalococcoidia bacterium]